MASMKEDWDLVITPKRGPLEINFGEIYRYRDFIYMFVERDLLMFYKQTILGQWQEPSFCSGINKSSSSSVEFRDMIQWLRYKFGLLVYSRVGFF